MATFYQNKPPHICSNCGGTGHTFRFCIEPVSSYGVLVFRWISRNQIWPQVNEFCKDSNAHTGTSSLTPQILMIQRKDTLGFMDIMRGKYKINEPEYIKKQLRGMTKDERRKLESMDFEEIWHQLWGSDAESSQRYAHDRVITKQKLAELRAGVELPNGECYSLSDLLRQEPGIYDSPEWGFPKGRREPHETDINCAFRELEEETSIKEEELMKVINVSPFIEQFYGSNNIHYRHSYYIAQYIGSRTVSFDIVNKEMTREIGNLAWKTLDEAIQLLRPENIEKKSILVQLANLLRNYSPIIRTPLTLIALNETAVNENNTEEQQGYYVFTGRSGESVPGKMEKSKRFFGARQTARRVSDLHGPSQSSNNEGSRSNEGGGGSTVSRH